MTPESFLRWAEQALPGDAAVYHVGYLPADRTRRQRETMAGQSARLAADLAARGLCGLTQRRIADGQYEYRIVWLRPHGSR